MTIACPEYCNPIELKLVSLKPPGNEHSEYVFKNVLACLWVKKQHEISGDPIFHSLGGHGVGQINPHTLSEELASVTKNKFNFILPYEC